MTYPTFPATARVLPSGLWTVSAAIRPCEMYADHGSAEPAYTQGHHLRPLFLQKRLWGEVRDETLWWLCGTCHDNLHGWLYALLGEWSTPPLPPPPRARRAAQQVLDWYQAAAAAA